MVPRSFLLDIWVPQLPALLPQFYSIRASDDPTLESASRPVDHCQTGGAASTVSLLTWGSTPMTTSVYLTTARRNAAGNICQWDEWDDSAARIQSSEKDLERQVD